MLRRCWSPGRSPKVLIHKSIKLLPIIAFIIMGAGIGVFMILAEILHTGLFEERDDRIVSVRLHGAGDETAVSLSL